MGIAAGRVPGLKLDRTGIALLGAIAILVFGRLPINDVIEFVNWPTILLLFGFFVLSAQLRLSGFFDFAANIVAHQLRNPARFMLLLMLATAGLSAFLNHDIVCFVFTPIVAVALLKRRLNPVPFLIALAISSNIGAAATLIGNPQNMMIAKVAALNFGPYAVWSIVPVVFALGSAYVIIWMLSRHYLTVPIISQTDPSDDPPRPFNRPHTIKGLVILVIVIGLFFSSLPIELVALTAAAVHLASPTFSTEDILKLVEWPILILFLSLFVVTGAFQSTGYGEEAVQWLALQGLHLDSLPTLVLVTAILSNIVGNSGAVMLLLNVGHISQPTAAYTLALANSFGGSLIIIGSISTIIVVQQARSLGIHISFRDFARLGVPVTLASLGILIIWVLLVT